MRELSAVLVIAQRDQVKFLRDPARLISGLIFPAVFIGIMGGTLQANLSANVGYSFLAFAFSGVLAQTLFMSSAQGVISLIEDRQNDFSQEIFVSPISRYSIVVGKILGEASVSLSQGVMILVLGVLLGAVESPDRLVRLLPVSIAVCFVGGAFGILVLANLGSQRAANQVFPFVMLPQFFTSGLFTPIQVLPLPLEVLSRISPLRYAVDLTRNVFYAGQPDYGKVVLDSPLLDGAAVAAMFALFLVVGTALFVRKERNR
jgi:ABC-2 type transport system permease protein